MMSDAGDLRVGHADHAGGLGARDGRLAAAVQRGAHLDAVLDQAWPTPLPIMPGAITATIGCMAWSPLRCGSARQCRQAVARRQAKGAGGQGNRVNTSSHRCMVPPSRESGGGLEGRREGLSDTKTPSLPSPASSL